MFHYVSTNDPGPADHTWLVDMLCHHPHFKASEYSWEDAAAWLQEHPEEARRLREMLTQVVV